MCFETTARPPLPPIAGGAGVADSARIVLEASDGNRFLAFGARAADPDAPGVMLLPDVRGLHPFYEDLAVRFAEVGVHATAMDYFGRTAGLDPRGEDFDHMAHVRRISPDGVGADTAATVAHLRSPAGGAAGRVYSMGFCMGGRISFNEARRDHGLRGVIGFYGGPQGTGPDDETAPIRLAPQYRCPVLGLFGGPMRASRPTRSARLPTSSTKPACRTRWSCTTARRIRSSTGSSNSMVKRVTTRGGGCWRSWAADPSGPDAGGERWRSSG